MNRKKKRPPFVLVRSCLQVLLSCFSLPACISKQRDGLSPFWKQGTLASTKPIHCIVLHIDSQFPRNVWPHVQRWRSVAGDGASRCSWAEKHTFLRGCDECRQGHTADTRGTHARCVQKQSKLSTEGLLAVNPRSLCRRCQQSQC